MLPVIVCEPNPQLRVQWMEELDELAHGDYACVRMNLMYGQDHELKRMIETESGVMLVILAISGDSKNAIDTELELFDAITVRNRDNYILLCIHDVNQIAEVLKRCMRPAGILIRPFERVRMEESLRRILDDYIAFQDIEDNDAFMMISSGRTIQRVAYKDILYLEACDKMLNICTKRHVITARMSLNTVESTLPKAFIRCHRSYIVNRNCIERMDMTNMQLELKTKEKLPISRSYKSVLRQNFGMEAAE